MRVAILPTGRCELKGLPSALRSLFPDHEFEGIAAIAPDQPFHAFTSSTRSKDNKPGWLKSGTNRRRHPKHYLEYLSRDPEKRGCTAYRETHEGANALALLDWSSVLSQDTHLQFLRAMVEDLAEGLAESSPTPPGTVAPQTARTSPRRERVLRNL